MSHRRTVTLPVLLALALALPPAATADFVHTGPADVPGTALYLDYTATARQLVPGSTTVHFQLLLYNPNPAVVNVIACSMLSISGVAPEETDVWNVTWNVAGWTCDTPYYESREPSYHFGCRPAAVPPNAWRVVVDQNAVFGFDFVPDQVDLFYMDWLLSVPIDPSCNGFVNRLNQYVQPVAPNNTFYNVWAGGAPFALTASGTRGASARLRWMPGNWVTMSYPEIYPVTLDGAVTGLPAGARVAIELPPRPGNDSPVRFDATVAPAKGDSCAGAPVEVRVPYVLHHGFDHRFRASVRFDLPDDPCGDVEPGRRARLQATVFADGDNPHYKAGEKMFDIAAWALHDPAPPTLERHAMFLGRDGALEVEIEARDEHSMVVGAEVEIRQAGRAIQRVALARDPDVHREAMTGVARLTRTVRGLEPGRAVEVRLHVADEVAPVHRSAWIALEPGVPWRLDR